MENFPENSGRKIRIIKNYQNKNNKELSIISRTEPRAG
jgi:hypothetical protein